MRYPLYATIVLILLWQTSAQVTVDDEEKKHLLELFGTPAPNNTTERVDLTPGNRGGSDSPQGSDAECTDSDNKPGVCVLHYQCNPDTGTVIVDGNTILDVRQRACPHYLEVCCQLEGKRPRPDPPVVETRACGWSNPGAQDFRIGGEDHAAEFGEFPWVVALLKRSDGNTVWSQSDYIGGGSIIHPSVVLTGAHKVDGKEPKEIKCRGGEWDTQTDKEIYPHQERNVKKIIKHESYYRPSVLNSIALLVLESPFDLSNAPHMGVGCLARAPAAPSTRCHSMGWGKEFNDKEKYAVILKKVELPAVSRKSCQNALRGTRLGSYFQLHPSLTCAGGEAGKDTCTGDGGSPLVCPIGDPDPSGDSSRYAITGMVAWGIGCGEAGVPGVYVNVPEFYDWIGEKMRGEGFDTSSYTI